MKKTPLFLFSLPLLASTPALAQGQAVFAGFAYPNPSNSTANVEIKNQDTRTLDCNMKIAGTVKSNGGNGPYEGVIFAQPNHKILRPNRAAEYEFDFGPEVQRMRSVWQDNSAILVSVSANTFKADCTVVTNPNPNPNPSTQLWTNDNGSARQSRGWDPINTSSASGQVNNGIFVISYQGMSVAPYHRLCDGVVSVRIFNSGLGEKTVRSYTKGMLVDANQPFQFTGSFPFNQNGNDVFQANSQVFEMSCLRWLGAGTPDPYRDPSHRPEKMPHQYCDPSQDNNGCQNTCKASPNNPNICESSNTRWPR